jgi:hypothetical protein
MGAYIDQGDGGQEDSVKESSHNLVVIPMHRIFLAYFVGSHLALVHIDACEFAVPHQSLVIVNFRSLSLQKTVQRQPEGLLNEAKPCIRRNRAAGFPSVECICPIKKRGLEVVVLVVLLLRQSHLLF